MATTDRNRSRELVNGALHGGMYGLHAEFARLRTPAGAPNASCPFLSTVLTDMACYLDLRPNQPIQEGGQGHENIVPHRTITGSSLGFGRAIAIKLAQEGAQKIAVHYLTRRNEAEKTLALLRDAGAEGVLVRGDTWNAKRAEEIVDEAAEKLGGCDIFTLRIQVVVYSP